MSLTFKTFAESSKSKTIEELLPDFPDGPLTPYRKQASFDWRKLKLSIYDEESVRYMDEILSYYQSDEVFYISPVTLGLDEQRHVTLKRMKTMKAAADFMPAERLYANPRLTSAWSEAFQMYDNDFCIKTGLTYSMFPSAIKSLGTEKHQKYVEATERGEINGCFALTEIAHGSNAKGMKVAATYDVNTKEFVINSPNFEAAKCWVGGLGQTATHAVLYAKLITSDGKDQGLHAFVVPIRCTKSLKPFPGVIVGDIGEKIGLNGIDNGFVMFDNYRVPKDALLNKLADVDDNGNYVTPFSDPNQRFGASFGGLSTGRVNITGMATNMLQKALAIAVRYSAVRRQFGPDDGSEELPVIEYQQQQFRLIPYVAATYASRIFYIWFSKLHTLFSIESARGTLTPDDIMAKSMEIHVLSSASKPITAWVATEAVQVCREACGGHGYLQAAGIGKIRNENDPNNTYEGENSVLIQQTSNWLISRWKKIAKKEKIITPYKSADYLNDFDRIIKSKIQISTSNDATNPKVLLDSYKWLVCYVLKNTAEKVKRLTDSGLDNFTAKNESQSYHAATLSRVFIEHAILETFHNTVIAVKDENCRKVLMKLVSLYGAWSLEKHLANLYMGGYFTGNYGHLLRDGILDLCKELKPEVVTLVDTLAPPDFFLNSALGKSDGNVYKNLQSTIFSYPGALSRPNWWRDVLNWETNKTSKL